MSFQMNRKQWVLSIAYGQGMIAVLTILNVFYPEYLSYWFVIFIGAMFVYMYFMMRTQLKHITSKEAKEIKTGRLLYKGKAEDIRELQVKDHLLVQELKPMMKYTFLSFLILIATFAWYPMYFNYAKTISESTVDLTTKIAVYLIGYEFPYALVMSTNLLSRKGMKEVVQVLNGYEIYDKGLLGMGLTIKFPVENMPYKVVADRSRKFVQFEQRRGKSVVKYRLYTKSVDRVGDILKRYGKIKEIEEVGQTRK
ncbi:MAG: DUF2208 family protein [Desulfurococcales archaeon]|nr:DUF2208 family protein [Desulfurococcales archaeon]